MFIRLGVEIQTNYRQILRFERRYALDEMFEWHPFDLP
jgi:hypothetical protein